MASKLTHIFGLSLPCIFMPMGGLANQTTQNDGSSFFSGVYFGAGIGANATTLHVDNSSSLAVTSIGPTTAPSKVSAEDNRGTVLGEIELGYSHLIKKNFYLGLSGFIDFADRKTSHEMNLERSGGAVQHDNKSSSNSFSTVTGGLTLEPGYLISPNTLFMSFFGWERAGIESTGYQLANVQQAQIGEQSFKRTDKLDGIRLGIGFQEQLTSALSFGIRYIYSDFLQDASALQTSQLPGNIMTGTFTYEVKAQDISTQTVLLNLRYYWNNSNQEPIRYTPHENDFGGFYLAGRLGTNIPNIGGDSSIITGSYVDAGSFDNSFLLTASQPQQEDNPAVDLAVGAGKVFNNFIYVGAEGTVQWFDKDFQSEITQGFRPTAVLSSGQRSDLATQKISVKLNDFEPAVDLKLGLVLAQRLLPYLRVGAAFNEIDYEASDQLAFTNQHRAVETVALKGKDDKNFSAFLRLGAGLDYQYSRNGVFNLNYIFTNYGDYKVDMTNTITDSAGNAASLSSDNSLSLRNNVVSIGYTHYFGG